MSWKLIDKHRRKARQISFDILVWGPSGQDHEGYQLRQSIKEFLVNKGHSAKFSEELIKHGAVAPAPDPIIDEVFQADAADLIIVLYGSRGTQTEFDVILGHDNFARKSVIMLGAEMLDQIKSSVSSQKWQNFQGEIITFPDSQFDTGAICILLDDFIEKLQFAEYYRRLKKHLID